MRIRPRVLLAKYLVSSTVQFLDVRSGIRVFIIYFPGMIQNSYDSNGYDSNGYDSNGCSSNSQNTPYHHTRRTAPRVLSLYDSAFTYDEKYMEWVPMGCGGHIG